MADVQAKLEQEEIADQSEQEKAMNNTEEDNAPAAEVAILNAEVGRQNDNINNNNGGDINGDMWELEDINEMEAAAAEFLGGYGDNVSGGGWGEWNHDGGETWREWEFYAAANDYYQDNDWVIDDLWVFDDHHYPNNNGDNAAAGANPRGPQA